MDDTNNTSSVFDETQSDDTNTNETDFLDQLVGEGKKFKTVQDLAKGKAESDRYVDQLRVELDNQKKLNEEKLDRLLESMKGKSTETAKGIESTARAPDSSRSTDEGKTSPKDAGEEIKSLVEKALKDRDEQTKTESNLRQSEQALDELFGEKARDVLKERAKTLGVTVDYLKQTASTSPSVFMKLVTGEDAKSKDFSTAQARVNSEALNASSNNRTSNKEQGWSYYSKLRKDNPSEFWRRHGEIYDRVQKVGAETFYKS